MKRSINIWKIIWISGIFAILITILYLVIIYKIKWEHKDLNTYMYIYNCDNLICTSTTKQNNYYSKVICENNICPYITQILDNDKLILNNNNKSWIYDYKTNKIINNTYISYKSIDNNTFIVTNELNKQGIINLDGEILIDLKYDYIDGYNNGYISYKENNLYGIKTPDDNYNVDAKFENIILINDKLYAGREENTYKIYSYNNSINSNDEYDYIYTLEDIILVISNKKIDILTTDLTSTLLMKINTFYEYKREKERDSLKIHEDNGILYFDVFTSETEYTTYSYNIKTKKLI